MSRPSDNESPLFRREVLEQAASHRHGKVLLVTAPAHNGLVTLFSLLAAGILTFLALASHTRSAQVRGVLVPVGGVLRVVAPLAGVVVERCVTEGQRVEAGDTLFRLRSEQSGSHGDDLLQTTAALLRSRRDSLAVEGQQQALQASERQQAARRRIAGLAAELQQAALQIELQQSRVTLAEAAAQRYQQLQASGYVALAQLQDRQAELLEQRQHLAELERSRMADARQKGALESELRDLGLQAERDNESSQRSIAMIDQDITANQAQREQLVLAPLAGMISATTVEPGQSAMAGQPLVSIIPANSPLEAELYAPSSAVGFLRPGMSAHLRYQPFPYQKFGQYPGQVREVSNSAMRRDELGLDAGTTRGSEMLYRVRISLDRQTVMANGAAVVLKPGTTVDASIALERRRLYEWLLEPLRSLGPRA
jgi:membrane fusion protein